MPPPSEPSGSSSTLLTRWGCAARTKIGARRSRRSEDRFQSLASASPLGVFSLSADGACEYANERLCAMTGRAEAHLGGTGLSLAFHPDDRAALHKAVTAAGGPSAALRLRLLLPDGSLRWVKAHAAPLRDSAGRVAGWVGSVEDVTTEVEAQIASRQIAADLTHKSRHDHLTGLPNRTFFTEQVAEILADDEIGGSVLFVDLDRFKVVNESLGHGAGDELLNLFADRLRAVARPGDLLARFGADEFVVGLVGVRDPIPAVAEAHRMLAALQDTMLVGGHEVMVTVSIGVAVGDDCDAATLVTRADTAMFQAKARGKARVELHRPEAPSSTGESTLELEARLRAAIDNDELRLHYQPVLSVRTREVVGVEALVRWQHPDRGLLAPGEFIPLAEESGLIVALGTWVLRTACAQLRQWRPALHAGPAFTLSVNVSARQLADPLFLSIVAGALRDHDVAPGSLCLEITETALLQDLETVDEVLRSLRAVGVRIAVDDFGTGYSSLSHLKLLPVDVIKVDRSFVKELGLDSDDTAIVGAVIRLAGALGMASVAEGVEEPDQLNWLGSLGCDMAQGFLLCRPQPADAIGAMLHGPRIVLPPGSTPSAPDVPMTRDPITPSGR